MSDLAQRLEAHAEERSRNGWLKSAAIMLEAATTLAAKDAEIARLREALELMVSTYDDGGWPTATIAIARSTLKGADHD